MLTHRGSLVPMVEVFDFKMKGETILQDNYVCYSVLYQYGDCFQATIYKGKAKNFNFAGVMKTECFY